MKYVIFGILILGVAAGAGWYYLEDVEKIEYSTTPTATLYFYDGRNTNDGYLITKQEVIYTSNPEDMAILALIDIHLDSFFADIEDHYLGLTIENGVATVNFAAPARAYLTDAAPNVRAVVINSITKTLMEFETVTKVQFSIEGRVVTP